MLCVGYLTRHPAPRLFRDPTSRFRVVPGIEDACYINIYPNVSYASPQSLVASRWPLVRGSCLLSRERVLSNIYFLLPLSTYTRTHSAPNPPVRLSVRPFVRSSVRPFSLEVVSMAGGKKKTKLSPRSKAYASPSPSPAVSVVHASGESSLPAGEPNLHVHQTSSPGPVDEPLNSSVVASSSVSRQSSETKQRGHNSLSTNDVEVCMILLCSTGRCWEIAKLTRNHWLRGGSCELVPGPGPAKSPRP